MTRPRKIFELQAHPIAPGYFYLDLVTQAGTYIKEFVHGDLGRTSPSLGDFLGGTECDILLLDVMRVELDFPPRLDPEPVLAGVPTMYDEIQKPKPNR